MSGMANAPVWLISQSEAQLLAGLIGRRLERIRFYVDASLEFDSCTLVAYPEIGTGSSPMFPNKEEIMRLSVRSVAAEKSARRNSSRDTQLDLGKHVRDIHILHSLVVFSEAVEVGPQPMGPIQLPAGLGYDAECINPSRVTREQLEQLVRRGCANFVDIGIIISLEEAAPVVIRTDGSSWRVLVTAELKRNAHQEIAAAVVLEDRSARPLSRPPSSC